MASDIESFRKKLDEYHTFPTRYPFKFIIRNDTLLKDKVLSFFIPQGATYTERLSKKKNYISLTIIMMVNSSDAIIKKYLEVDTLEENIVKI